MALHRAYKKYKKAVTGISPAAAAGSRNSGEASNAKKK